MIPFASYHSWSSVGAAPQRQSGDAFEKVRTQNARHLVQHLHQIPATCALRTWPWTLPVPGHPLTHHFCCAIQSSTLQSHFTRSLLTILLHAKDLHILSKDASVILAASRPPTTN